MSSVITATSWKEVSMRSSPTVLTFCIVLCAQAAWGCGPSEQHCQDVEEAAAQHVLDAIGGDQPCTVADDCEVVWVNGSCFDVCSRVIAVANTDAFEQALDEAEAENCVDYEGCTLSNPPCASPLSAVCGADGQCEDG
jgi:hypothetical protein